MRIHHLALRTLDVPRLERFYAEVFGLEVLRRDAGRSVWLDAAGTIVMLEQRSEAEPTISHSSKELVCFAITPAEHERIRARLHTAGVPVEDQTRSTLYFRDPDGRRVGVSAYPDEL